MQAFNIKNELTRQDVDAVPSGLRNSNIHTLYYQSIHLLYVIFHETTLYAQLPDIRSSAGN
jgi:hypothetical protein